MAASKWVVKFANANTDPSNYQMCDVDVNPVGSPTDAQIGAQIIAYFAAVSGGMGEDTYIAEVTVRHAGDPGATSFPFPQSQFDAVVAAAFTDSVVVPDMDTGYAVSFGDGALAPLGTSISVSEVTAHAGRTGRGRHFLPFAGENQVSAGGTVGTGHIANIVEAYNELLRGIKPAGGAATSPIVDLNPVVTNAAGSTNYPVTLVKPQPIYSNLESRRR